MDEKVNTCNVCKKTFMRFKDLRKHAKKFHEDKPLESIAPLKVKSYPFQCTWCKKNFSHKRNLNVHLKTHTITENSNVENIDNVILTIDKVGKICPLCDYTGKFKVNFYQHFEQAHHINIDIEKQQFSSSDNFSVWFSKIEKDTQTKFIIEKRSRSNKKIQVNYKCHRSGFFKTRSSGQRHLKTQGSKKINGYCPAGLEVMIDKESGIHDVTFVKSHVGHQNDLCHLFLSEDERVIIAEKIAMKVPVIEILDSIRDSKMTSDFERIDLLTKKDIFNIKASIINIRQPKNETKNKVKKKSLSAQKTEFIAKMLNTINSVESEKELSAAAKILSTVEPTIKAIRRETEISNGKIVNKTVSRSKNIEH